MKPKSEWLNGKYASVYGEVVDCDVYGLRDVPFTPDVVFDIGANVGIFTEFARTLWPLAAIVAVEPNKENYECFRSYLDLPNIILVEAALGMGPIYRSAGAANGAMECYLPVGLGYPLEKVVKNSRLVETKIEPKSLSRILGMGFEGAATVLKIDCEGGENSIWLDSDSVSALHEIDYIAMELHYYAIDNVEATRVRDVTDQFLKRLEATHYCSRVGTIFKALKR